MKRKDVYISIDSERNYQDTERKENEKETRHDNEKSISDFLIYIEHMVSRAKGDIYKLDELSALHTIRKIAGLCVACGESFGMPKRRM